MRAVSGHGYTPRAAFSLAELVVSLGILVLMLTLAGQVMTLTTKSTGQAKAVTEVNQSLRVLERNLRDDLRFCEPGRSMMVIVGNPVNAYWTRAAASAYAPASPIAGYFHPRDPDREDDEGNLLPPRADMLMFFSTRRATSYVRYQYKDAPGFTQPPVSSNLQQVVYGHARLGEWIPDGNGGYTFDAATEAFPPFPTMQDFPVPAERWHLARRSIVLLPLMGAADTLPAPPVATPAWVNFEDDTADQNKLDYEPLLRGETDVVWNFEYEARVLIPSGNGPLGVFPFFLPRIFEDSAVPFARSMLDETPPPRLADRLGHYFVPRCASFKVEWALDTESDFVGGLLDGEKQVFWFDPGDTGDDPDNPTDDKPLRSLETAWDTEDELYPDSERSKRLDELLKLPRGGALLGSGNQYTLRQRFGTDIEWRLDSPLGDNRRYNVHTFTATRGEPDELAPEDIFPKALRITVDVYDEDGRLDRPIRHVMIIPVGESGL